MKIIYVIATVVLGLGLFSWEANWRIGHSVRGHVSSGGAYVAQVYSMPEGSALPYGQGVYVRRRYIPLWATSAIVFAGYCKPEIQLQWLTAKHLSVKCAIAEGVPKQFSTPGDVVVTHDGVGS